VATTTLSQLPLSQLGALGQLVLSQIPFSQLTPLGQFVLSQLGANPAALSHLGLSQLSITPAPAVSQFPIATPGR
jgi:hypothetical protein